MEIRWIVSAAASSLYAAGQLLRGRVLVDTPLAEKLKEPVEEFATAAQAWQLDPSLLVNALTAISVEPISFTEQALAAVRKTCGSSRNLPIITAVAGWLPEVQNFFTEVHPNALVELELRSSPLREQWEARGPGLWAQLRKLLGPQSLVENADVILVQPVTGGGGVAHVTANRVSFEAVLANPHQQLPEVMRLAWLLAQLQLDLPDLQGNLTASCAYEIGALAAVPAVLQAAYDVELCPPLEQVLPAALPAWRQPSVDADTLLAWWETYQADRPPWGVALAALDQLVNR